MIIGKRGFSLASSLLAGLVVVGLGMGMSTDAKAQETDFSPFARFGLGTSQGQLSPGLASTVGLISVNPDNVFINPDQPASAAALGNPTFQGSIHVQCMQLSEGDATSNAWTGGPGNFGLVVKRPRARSAFSLGLTPMTSKAYLVQRSLTDTALGEVSTAFEGEGGLARAYMGLSHGWREKSWVAAGQKDSVQISVRGWDLGAQVDHWFGDALQTSRIDILDPTFRDARTVVSSRQRATGFILGAEAFQVLRARYDDLKQFRGSWVMRLGATWSPERALNTDFTKWTESTVLLSGVVTGIDTTEFIQTELQGTVPSKWTLGGGLQFDGSRGNRFGVFVDLHAQSWSNANASLGHLMDGDGSWADAWSRSIAMVWTPGRKPGRITRTTYRAGFSHAMLPLDLASAGDAATVQLQEWRASCGFNVPLKGSRSASQLHFGMDFGRRYTDLESYHRESNMRVHIGVTLTPFVKNLWLTPRLYD